jgi:hypothetical protein
MSLGVPPSMPRRSARLAAKQATSATTQGVDEATNVQNIATESAEDVAFKQIKQAYLGRIESPMQEGKETPVWANGGGKRWPSELL